MKLISVTGDKTIATLTNTNILPENSEFARNIY